MLAYIPYMDPMGYPISALLRTAWDDATWAKEISTGNMYGDGRSISVGEVVMDDGKRWELQLKGWIWLDAQVLVLGTQIPHIHLYIYYRVTHTHIYIIIYGDRSKGPRKEF